MMTSLLSPSKSLLIPTVVVLMGCVSPYLNLKFLISSPFTLGIGTVAALIGLCYSEMVKVGPTSTNLGNDIAMPHAWPLRAIDFLIKLSPGTMWDVFDADALLQEGAAIAGLSPDLFSPLVVESISKFCDSLKSDNVELNWAGRKNLHFIITSGLSQYLLVHHHAKHNPKVTEVKLNKPLIVAGLPRSGTTHLHRLLSEVTDDSMPIPLWQHFFPRVPRALEGTLEKWLGGDLPRRMLMHVNFFAWKFVANQYGMDSVHMVRPDLPDECHFSLRMSGACVLLWNLAPVFEYSDWLLDPKASKAHVQHAYETYRLSLQLLQAEDPHRRFVLKSPDHTGNIGILRKVIPESVVVVTHRDPSKTSLSYCSLNTRMQAAGCHNLNWRRSIQQVLKKDSRDAEVMMEYCRKKDDPNIYHVSYKQLLSEPIRLVKDIGDTLQIPMEDDMELKLQTYMISHGQHAHGKHLYSYEGMEVKEEDFDRAFSAYKTFFQRYL